VHHHAFTNLPLAHVEHRPAADGGKLKLYQVETTHYHLVPSTVWSLLVQWYGTVPGQSPIARTMVGKPGDLRVET